MIVLPGGCLGSFVVVVVVVQARKEERHNRDVLEIGNLQLKKSVVWILKNDQFSGDIQIYIYLLYPFFTLTIESGHVLKMRVARFDDVARVLPSTLLQYS